MAMLLFLLIFVSWLSPHVATATDVPGTDLLSCSGCTVKGDGTTDDTAALQALIDAAPDNSTFLVPRGAVYKLTSTISLVSRVGLTFKSDMRQENFGGSGTPVFRWFGTASRMFFMDHSDHISFVGLRFDIQSGSTLNTILDFDGQPSGHIGTAGLVRYCTLHGGQTPANASFRAISIASTASSNHENYVIDHNQFAGTTTGALRRAIDGVTTVSSTTVTSATATFVVGDAGKRILLSWATGALDTTIATYVSPTQITIATPATASQTAVAIHTDRAYGIGIYQGNSLNALNEIYTDNNFYWLEAGIFLTAGGATIDGVSGYGNDTDVYVMNIVSRLKIANLQTENSVRSIYLLNTIGPTDIDGDRGSNSNARADGWIYITGAAMVTIRNSRVNFDISTNAVHIGHVTNNTVNVSFINNDWAHLSTVAKTGIPSLNNFTNQFRLNNLNLPTDTPPNHISTFNKDLGLNVHAFSRNYTGNPVIGVQGQADNWITPNGGGAGADEFIGVLGLSGVGGSSLGAGDFYGVRGKLALSSRWLSGVAVDAQQATIAGNGGGLAAYSIRAAGPTSVISGILPNNYGLYLGPHKVTNVTNGWGVYQTGALDKNLFAGLVNVENGILYVPGSRPTCDVANRGRTVNVQGTISTADSLEICLKDAAGLYVWVAVRQSCQ